MSLDRPSLRLRRSLLSLLLGCGLAMGARGALVINEVHYDPAGADRGAEWVELYNSGAWPATLEGVWLEAGDGAGPGRWSRAWQGQAGEWIEAGGYYWIGGPFSGRAPDAAFPLNLQNGPDGVRLLREGLELDRLGWGEHLYPEYFEGRPAACAPSGRSVARKRDGADTDDNADDFETAAPTPGRPNHPAVDLAVRLLRPGRPLPLPVAAGEIRATVCLRNLGSEPLDPASVRLFAGGQTLLPGPAGSDSLPEPGEEKAYTVLLAVGDPCGLQAWTCRCRVDGDPVPENDCDTLRLWVGPAPLRFSEISPRPESGGSEWVELQNPSTEPLALGGWSMRDCAGTLLRIDSTAVLPPEGLGLLARGGGTADSAAAGLSGLAALCLPWNGSWPSLNDAADPGEAADTLFLFNRAGILVDWAAFGEIERGRTWIRVSGPQPGLSEWEVSPGPSGTPGAPNPGLRSAVPFTQRDGSSGFTLRRDRGGVWFRLQPSLFPGRWRLRIYTLEGDAVWSAEGAGVDRMERFVRWSGRRADGRLCAPGVYLVRLASRPEGGKERLESRALVCGR